jgi:hypothetical protein
MVDQLCAVSVVNVSAADAAACTNTFRRLSPHETLSKQFWGVDLCEQLPRAISQDGTQAVPGDLGRIQQFLTQHFSCLREEATSAASNNWLATVKRTYLANSSDLVELRHEDRTVGAVIGAPEDWATYYVRIFAMAPNFQKRPLIRRFIRECLFEPLAACGVQRITAETSPANHAMARLFTELQFHVTGHQLTERWGPLVRYTKFLDRTCEAAFLERFGNLAP